MSQLKLSGDASGTGIVTIAAPNTNSTYTVTLPAAAGTIITTASAATPTTLGPVYGSMTTGGASPYLTALGYNAAPSASGAHNTAVGYLSAYSITSGDRNVAVGNYALNGLQTGVYNTAIGFAALYTNTGSSNTAVGKDALYLNTSGAANVGVGVSALYNNTTASNNTAVGAQALYNNTTGASNTAVGHQSGYSVNGGASNVLLGLYAGYELTTGSYNVYIGPSAGRAATTVTNEIVIGSAGGSNLTGKGSSTGFISPGGGGVYQGNNSSSWSTTSDQRLKKNIVDNTEGLDKISQIRVRNFEYRLPDEVDPELKPSDAVQRPGIQLGVIAQELQQVCPDCVKEESTGVLSVDSDNVFWHMVNAIKELNTRLQAAEAEIATLKGN